MIFRWFGGKRREPTRGELMALSFDVTLVDHLERLADKLTREEPAARTMALVGLVNITSILRTHQELNQSDGTGLPTTYADYGRMVALMFDKYPPTNLSDQDLIRLTSDRSVMTPAAEKAIRSEIAFRRLYHFFHAATLGAVSERAHATHAHLEQLANIWRSYIDSARHLQPLLSHTEIWSKDETDWFDICIDEKSSIATVIYTVVPKFLWEHDEMLSMVKQQFGVRPSRPRR